LSLRTEAIGQLAWRRALSSRTAGSGSRTHARAIAYKNASVVSSEGG
jgi:hypothetical protein